MQFYPTACQTTDLGAPDTLTNSKCGPSFSRSVSIANGVGCFDATSTGSVVTYQCDANYTLSGNSQRTCLIDGNWNGSIPCRVCEKYTWYAKCYVHNSKVTFYCIYRSLHIYSCDCCSCCHIQCCDHPWFTGGSSHSMLPHPP